MSKRTVSSVSVVLAMGLASMAYGVQIGDFESGMDGWAVSNPDRTAVATGDWVEWKIPLSNFTSAGVNLGSVKKLYLGVGDRSAPRIGGTGRLNIDDIRLEP